MAALESDQETRFERRVERLQGCCAVPELRRDESGLPKIRFNACRDRLCPRCQRQRGMAIREKVLAVVKTFNAPRFATLTLAHQPRSLRDTHTKLAACFRELRKTREWKERVTAGVWVIECTLNEQAGTWHLHVHLIIDGTFFPQALLSKVWHRVTGDSMVCDIRAVPDRAKYVAYMADYVAKPVGLADWDDDKIREFAAAMHGVRMVHTFGKCHKATVEHSEPEIERTPTTFVTHTLTLVRLVRAGNAKALFAFNTLSSWRRDVCEAIGGEWRPSLSGTRLVSDADVKQALSVCDELERGKLIDRPPITEPTPAEFRDRGLFTKWSL